MEPAIRPLAKRHAEQPEDAEWSTEGEHIAPSPALHVPGFARGIHEHETRGALRVIGREHRTSKPAMEAPTSTTGPAIPRGRGVSPARWQCGALSAATAGIAVAHTRAIVGAGTREPRDFRLDEAPVGTCAAKARVEDYGGRAIAGAPQMQSVPADVDELPGRWSRRELLSSRKPLVT